MAFREHLVERGASGPLPASPYCLSLSRGDVTRAVALAPALFWALASLLPASLGAGVIGAAYLLCHDAVVIPPAEQTAEAQDTLAAERGRFDAENSRRLIEEGTLERRVSDFWRVRPGSNNARLW